MSALTGASNTALWLAAATRNSSQILPSAVTAQYINSHREGKYINSHREGRSVASEQVCDMRTNILQQ